MSPNPTQHSLFDDAADPAAQSTATSLARALVEGDDTRAQTRWQREFGKLSASVTALRRALDEATELRDAYQAYVAKVFEPRWRELLAVRREWVLAGDRVLQGQSAQPKGQRLSSKRRRLLAAFLVEQINDLFEHDGIDDDDEELAAIHDRWSDISLDESRELDEALAKSMRDVLGGHADADADAEADEQDEQDIDPPFSDAHEDVNMRSRAQEDRRRNNARGEKARAKREQAAKDVSQSVREVYRKLASALHPDRETDPAERERKTQLMQRANQAYEKGDLLTLLSMQISLIESDQGALARTDDKRLQLYCQALREQQQSLRREIADVEAPIRDALNLVPGQRMPERSAVLVRIERDAKGVTGDAAGIRDEIAALLDPKRCGPLVDGLPLPDFDEIGAWLTEAVMGRSGKPRGRGRRR